MADVTTDWIRKDERELAEELAGENLAHANSMYSLVVPRKGPYVKYVKRALDVILSGSALVVTLPINCALLVATYLDVGRPVLFKQYRTGRDLKPFVIVKFRNMTNEKDENGELLPPAQRVTKLGKFVRKYSLDELLNFWSVFKGDMSIIGPRPLPEEYVDRLTERHKQRYLVKPGLECPFVAEVKEKYPCPDPYSRYQTQFENDVWYVEHVSFATDVKECLLLVKAVLDFKQRTGAAGVASHFIGYDENGAATSKKHLERHAGHMGSPSRVSAGR